VDVGVAFGLATAATNPTPAGVARFDLALALPDDAWRVRLSASGVGEQTIDVPPGRATWRRLSGALAVDRVLSHFSERRGAWLLGVGPSLGYLSVRGEGYTVNHHAVLADVGAELGTRLERASGRWRGWWGVAATWWMRPQQLEVSGVGGTVSERALPRIEVAMVLGVAMSFLPFEK
jgi:imidazoleglycerol phosphate dehydratase HisB